MNVSRIQAEQWEKTSHQRGCPDFIEINSLEDEIDNETVARLSRWSYLTGHGRRPIVEMACIRELLAGGEV
jgi:hypothetical protein